MEAWQQCHDVIVRLRAAWRADDACGSLQRAKSAFLDAARVLAPSDIRRLAVEALGHRPAMEPTARGQLTPERQLEMARLCSVCAELCDVLTYLEKHDEAVEPLEVDGDVLDEGWHLVSRMWPEYLQTHAEIPTEIPPQYTSQAEFIYLLLTLIRAFSEKLLLPVLNTWEWVLLFENALTRTLDYAETELVLWASIVKVARRRDLRTIASLISQADTTNARVAGALSALGFWLKLVSIDIFKFLRSNLSLRVVDRALDRRYFTLSGSSAALNEIAQSQVSKRFKKFESSLSFDFPQREESIRHFLEGLHSTLVAQQNFEMPLLKEREKITHTCQPVSLDAEVEDEEGETTFLSECLPAEEDLLDAVDRYYEAVSHLPEDMQPIFRRAWEEGETLKQAAINLGYQWAPALERKIQRMIKKIYEEMLS
jgi:hypothetical protein